MKKLLLIFFVIALNHPITKAQCPPGASALQSSYIQCASGCGVLLVAWPAGVLVNIYGGSPLSVLTSAVIPGTLGSGGTGSALVCVPCNIPLFFASTATGATSGCVIAVIPVLPVKLNSFSVVLKNDKSCILKWTASQESGKVKYVAQRSNNGISFTDLVTIAANDNNLSGNTYSYEDMAVTAAVNYYRLKVIEVSGDVSYSPTISIKKQTGFGFSVYPNPVVNNFKVNIPEKFLPASVEIFDAQGKQVYSAKTTQASFPIDKQLQNGIYAVKVTGNNNISITQKIIKK